MDSRLVNMQTLDSTLVPGAIIADWRVAERLGSGSRGESYRVVHQFSEQPAVMRLLPAGRSADDGFRSRFFSECDSVAGLTAPEVARVLGWGDHDGRIWCVTESLAEGTLADRLNLGWVPDSAEVMRIGIAAARGLAAAHLAGVLHRGLQPSDLLLSTERVAVAGFALTSDLSGREALSDALELPSSPICAAPERQRRKPTDQRSDLYALGCVLYWAMARRPPFSGEPAEIARQHLENMPIPLRVAAPFCPPGLDEVVTCLLRKDPQFRYPNAMALLDDLERVNRGGTANQARQIRSAETSRAMPAAAPPAGMSVARSSGDHLPPPQRQPPPAAQHQWLAIALVMVAAIAGGTAVMLRTRAVAPEPSTSVVSALAAAPVGAPAAPTATSALPAPVVVTPLATVEVPDVTQQPPAGPLATELVAAKAEVETARVKAQEAKIVAMIKTGAHLGPIEDLTAQLGAPDFNEDLGGRIWYGDYSFNVADGLVLGVTHHQKNPVGH